jgi:hypothetical protein
VKPRPDPETIARRELYKIASAYGDMCIAAAICEHYIKLIRDWDVQRDGKVISQPLNYAFMSSIVTAYSRPFSSGDLGTLSKKWLKFPQPGMKDLHEKMVATRHEVYAHSDARVPLTVYPPGCAVPGRASPHNGTWSFERQEFPPDILPYMMSLAVFMKTNLERETAKLVDQVGSEWKPGDSPIVVNWM